MPQNLETLGNGVLEWRLEGFRFFLDERRGMMESSKNQHSFTLDIPAQFEQCYTQFEQCYTKALYPGVFKQNNR